MKDLLLAGLDVSSLYTSDKIEKNNTSIIDFNGSENARKKSSNHFSIIRADGTIAERTYYNSLGHYLVQLVDTMVSEKEFSYVIPGSGWDLSLESSITNESIFGEAELIGTSVKNFIKSRSLKYSSDEINKQGLETVPISSETINESVSVVLSDFTFSSNPFSSSLQLLSELSSFQTDKEIINLGSLNSSNKQLLSLLYYVTETTVECVIMSSYEHELRDNGLIMKRILKDTKTIETTDPLHSVLPLLEELTLKLGWLGWGQVDLIQNNESTLKIVALYPWPTSLCHGIRWAGLDPLDWQIRSLNDEKLDPPTLKKEL
ncbi:MAG: hypothetical protein KAR35_10440, partial [Candidatus Heimdallarchaeota archaeon]|nr:hypothetical protein [Candidatus Heimdallarchaeota archaeon]MCK5049775.1 hypothetical protein [Candidatus Heimdallarchaeota archaeon]